MKKWLIALAALFALYYGYNFVVDGFSSANIYFTSDASDTQYKISHTTEERNELKKAVDQPFYYLGKGRQSYAFISEDGKWVLKFFKCQRLKLSLLYLPLEKLGLFKDALEDKKAEKEDRLERLFYSAYLAATVLPEETGIKFANFTPGSNDLPNVVLINNAHISSTVDLNKTPFCLQQRGIPAMTTFKRLVAEGKISEAKERIDQLIALLKAKRSKEVLQHDAALIIRNNVGFTDNRAIFIDIGSFAKGKLKTARHPEQQQLKPLLRWLQERDQELADYLEAQMIAQL